MSVNNQPRLENRERERNIRKELEKKSHSLAHRLRRSKGIETYLSEKESLSLLGLSVCCFVLLFLRLRSFRDGNLHQILCVQRRRKRRRLHSTGTRSNTCDQQGRFMTTWKITSRSIFSPFFSIQQQLIV